LTTTNLSEIKKTGELVKSQSENVPIVKAKVTKIEALGSG